MSDILSYYNYNKNKFTKTKHLKYHDINMFYFYNNDFNFDIDNTKKILRYFKKNNLLKNNMVISILDIDVDKVLCDDWKKFQSGFYISNRNNNPIFITRTKEYTRTLIHELVHCCFRIFDEIETEMKTIEIYKELFGLPESQLDHSYKLYKKLLSLQSNNLYKYLSAYLINDLKIEKKCNCNFDNSFTYICK